MIRNPFKLSISTSTFIIAEISGNHGGKLSNALKLIHLAKKVGASAVKFQAYTADSITINSDNSDFRIPKNNAWQNFSTLHELYTLAQTPFSWIPKMIAYAKKVNIPIFASVFDLESIQILEKNNIKAYKIASPEVSDYLILEAVGKTRKPVFISNGLSDLSEVMRANNLLEKAGAREIYWMKANTSYPPPFNEVNLKTIAHMRELFQRPVGFSDHTLGFDITLAAVACGAQIIEKHIKINDENKTVDDFFSLNPRQFSDMVQSIRRIEVALGKVSYDIPVSSQQYLNGKRSIYVSKRIRKGESFTKENIKSVRPGFSLSSDYYYLILGSKSNRNLEVGDRVSLSDLIFNK